MLPDTEEAFIRHYSLNGEDVEIIGRYRTPETRLAFALQLCVLRYPGRVLRQGEIMPLRLLAFIADQVRVSPDAITGFSNVRFIEGELPPDLKPWEIEYEAPHMLGLARIVPDPIDKAAADISFSASLHCKNGIFDHWSMRQAH